MLRYPELPFLPGYVLRDVRTIISFQNKNISIYIGVQKCYLQPNKNRFHLSQYFEVRNGVSMLVDNERTADNKLTKILHGKPSFYPPFEGPRLPPWVAYDKKVTDSFYFSVLSVLI